MNDYCKKWNNDLISTQFSIHSYEKPERHWQLDDPGKPTGVISDSRRASIHLVPIPSSQRKRKQQAQQAE